MPHKHFKVLVSIFMTTSFFEYFKGRKFRGQKISPFLPILDKFGKSLTHEKYFCKNSRKVIPIEVNFKGELNKQICLDMPENINFYHLKKSFAKVKFSRKTSLLVIRERLSLKLREFFTSRSLLPKKVSSLKINQNIFCLFPFFTTSQ